MTQAPLPIIQSIPHSGFGRPPELDGRLLLDDVAIYNECDLWVDQLFDFAHPALGPGGGRGSLAVVTTEIARAIVDVNRTPDDLENADGVVKAQTSYGVAAFAQPLDLADKALLRDRYWGDYHGRLQAALRQHQGAARLLLDCHNMAQIGPRTYAYAGRPRPLICLANLGDRSGEPRNGETPVSCPPALLRRAGEIAARLFAGMELLEPAGEPPPVVALNYPFAGGYIVRQYAAGAGGPVTGAGGADATPRAPMAIMIEVNRGLFVGNQTASTPVSPPNQERIDAIRSRLYQWAVELAASLP